MKIGGRLNLTVIDVYYGRINRTEQLLIEPKLYQPLENNIQSNLYDPIYLEIRKTDSEIGLGYFYENW